MAGMGFIFEKILFLELHFDGLGTLDFLKNKRNLNNKIFVKKT